MHTNIEQQHDRALRVPIEPAAGLRGASSGHVQGCQQISRVVGGGSARSMRRRVAVTAADGGDTASSHSSASPSPSRSHSLSPRKVKQMQNVHTRHTTRPVDFDWYKARPSLMTSEHSADTFRGMLNFVIIMLGLTHVHMVYSNLMKYGLLLRLGIALNAANLSTVGLVLSAVPIYYTPLLIQRGLLACWYRIGVAKLLYGICAAAQLVVPIYLNAVLKSWPPLTLLFMIENTAMFLKVVSFAHFNIVQHERYLAKSMKQRERERIERIQGTAEVLVYPFNITFANMTFFALVPTLVYSLNFPRTERIRKRFLVRHVLQLVFFCSLIVVIWQQYMMPVISTARAPYASGSFLEMSERILRLAVPNIYFWLASFFTYFHLYLNIMAELTRFADREFYRDWWNATTSDYFWKTWNIPVHNWFLSHVYFPMIRAGWSREVSVVAVFTITSILHEVVVSTSFRCFKILVFFGFMLEIPLSWITAFVKGQQIGNIIVWMHLILGQPFAILMYAVEGYEMLIPPVGAIPPPP